MPSPPPISSIRDRVAARLFGLPPPADVAPPSTIGRFTVLRPLGEGGMGVVYLCSDPKLGRDVAIKLLHPGLAIEPSRLLREAQALAKLAHPNVVPLFEVGDAQQQTFLAMEYVDGVSLRDWLAEPRTWRDVVEMFLQAAAGLTAAHRAGIVHRDFKPSNLRVGKDGRVRVLDFGLARASGTALMPGTAQESPSTPSPASDTTTHSGTLAGTPAYMAPEQIRGTTVDARADQWSFCVASWEALYKIRPFHPEHLRGQALPPPRALGDNGPYALREILLRGLSLDPAQRWPDIASLAERLERILAKHARRRTIGAFAVSGVTCALLAAWWTPANACDPNVAAIDPTWGPARRAAVFATLEANVDPSLRPVASWWADRLDAHRDAWLAAEQQACRSATDGRGADAEVQQCLVRSRVALADLVVTALDSPSLVLARVGTDVGAAAALDDLLGDPLRCLGAKASGAAPSEAAWALVASARANLAAGDLGRARDHARTLADLARRERSPLVEMFASELEGVSDVQEGWTERGVASLLHAIDIAEANHADFDAARDWIALVDAGLMHLHDADVAAPWLDRADAAVARAGDDPLQRFQITRARAVLASMRDDDAAATESLDRAGQQLDALLETRGARVERLALDRGNHALSRGRIDDARAHFDRALLLRTERVGADHPSNAAVEIALGRAAKRANDPKVARRNFTRAVALLEVAFGANSPRLSSPLAGLAESQLLGGDSDAAEATAVRTAAIQDRLPAVHPDRGGGLALLGMIAELRGDNERAAQRYLEAADAKSGLADAASRLEAVNNAGWHLNNVGRVAEARAQYEWLEVHTGESSQMHVLALAGLGRSMFLEGDVAAATRTLDVALRASQTLEQPNSMLVPEIRWHLASALHSAGRDADRRRNLAALALADYRTHWPGLTKTVAELERLASPAPPADTDSRPLSTP